MNIAEILKKCPKGTKLYSPVYGEVEFVEVVDNRDDYYISCVNKRGFYESFAIDGRLLPFIPDTECMLFPSKDQRDWNKFVVPDQVNEQKPKTELKPFDKVLVRDDDGREWRCDIFSHLGYKGGVFICFTTWWKQCIPYEGNEHLLGTTNNPEE